MIHSPDDDSGSRDSAGPPHSADGAVHASATDGFPASRGGCDQASLDALSGQQLGWLLATIESDVVPRLVGAHRRMGNAEALREPRSHPVPEGSVDRMVELLLRDDHARAFAWLEDLVEAGTPVESVYLGILGPAARRFGERWIQDTSDFTQVTIAVWRLQEIMYGLHAAFLDDAVPSAPARRILLAPSPGSHHTFGMLMVAEFFRRAGWGVWSDPSASEREVIQAARNGWFDVVGISVGVTDHLPLVSSAVRAVRKASRNPGVVVMLGGPAVTQHPEYVALAGADAMAVDAADAVAVAERFLPAHQPGTTAPN